MSALASGLILTFLTFTICGLMLGFHPYMRRVTNSYIFWLVTASALLIYFIFTRYWADCSNLINYEKGNFDVTLIPNQDYPLGWLKSRVFLTDMCPFFYVVILFSLILQPSRKVAQCIAPLLFFAALITFISSIMIGDGGNAAITAEYIFWGYEIITLKFWLHFTALLVSLGVMLNTPNKKWITFLWSNLWAAGFFIYISIVSYGFNVECQVCYIRPSDWGQYGDGYVIAELFPSLSFPVIIIIPLGICYVFILLIWYLQYILQNKTKYYAIADKPVYKNIWLDEYYYIPNTKKSNKRSR